MDHDACEQRCKELATENHRLKQERLGLQRENERLTTQLGHYAAKAEFVRFDQIQAALRDVLCELGNGDTPTGRLRKWFRR